MNRIFLDDYVVWIQYVALLTLTHSQTSHKYVLNNRYADEALLSSLADEVSTYKFSKRDVRFELEKLERFMLDAVREYHEDEKEGTSSEKDTSSCSSEEDTSSEEEKEPTETITETMQSLRLNTTSPPKPPLIQVIESVDNDK